MMNFNMNPMEMIGLLKGRDPQELVMSMIKNNNINDPQINELISLAEKGDTNSLTKIATDMFAKQGKNFNSEFSNFMSLLK